LPRGLDGKAQHAAEQRHLLAELSSPLLPLACPALALTCHPHLPPPLLPRSLCSLASSPSWPPASGRRCLPPSPLAWPLPLSCPRPPPCLRPCRCRRPSCRRHPPWTAAPSETPHQGSPPSLGPSPPPPPPLQRRAKCGAPAGGAGRHVKPRPPTPRGARTNAGTPPHDTPEFLSPIRLRAAPKALQPPSCSRPPEGVPAGGGARTLHRPRTAPHPALTPPQIFFRCTHPFHGLAPALL
jgi:hypothetical protein